MWIADSARRHQVEDDDIRHAVRNAFRIIDVEDVQMLIGADRRGRLLEIGVLTGDDELVVIHAMPARPKFLR